MCTVGPQRFVAFLNRFRVDHPGIDITLIDGIPDKLTEKLRHGDIDVAVMASPIGFDAPLRAQPLYREAFVVACSTGHPFETRRSVAVADMDQQTYLQRINCEFRDHLADVYEQAGATLLRSYRGERGDWIMTMVASGLGVCFIPEFSATLPGLLTRRVHSPAVARNVCAVTVSGRRWSAPTSAFMQAITHHAWAEAR